MRGKSADGEWKQPFSPLYSKHRDDEYTEGNAWQYSWFVPHDVEGLIALHNGKEAFSCKLDSLFTLEAALEGEDASPDISGFIGQYAHGNEPSHHIAYLYNYTGQPEKTQFYVNEILSNLYKNTPDGLCGNVRLVCLLSHGILSCQSGRREIPVRVSPVPQNHFKGRTGKEVHNNSQ